MQYQSQFQKFMSFLFFFTFFFALSFFVFSFYLYRWLKKTEQQNPIQQIQKPNQSDPLEFERSFSETQGMNHHNDEKNSTQLSNSAHSLLLEILSSHSSKLTNLFGSEEGGDPDFNGSALGRKMNESSGDQKGKKKKRKTKKKTSNSNCEERCVEEKGNLGPGSRAKQDLVCLYPFTSSSSATQKKIKLQYDELVKSHESKGLTLAQVGQFVNCLVEARNELQHKADVIQRKFTITKALLYKADRSSFDRLRQQIYKLEFEQKRLEEDAFVYNWLQQQLKLSPAYKKMLEIGECTELKSKAGELKSKAGELKQNTDSEFSEITFEELLAQEKKDSFWQRNGKIRSCSN